MIKVDNAVIFASFVIFVSSLFLVCAVGISPTGGGESKAEG